jgi:hypothetical protein
MPASPRWLSRINEICTELASLPRPFVDRATAEAVLGVGRRRAQQFPGLYPRREPTDTG